MKIKMEILNFALNRKVDPIVDIGNAATMIIIKKFRDIILNVKGKSVDGMRTKRVVLRVQNGFDELVEAMNVLARIEFLVDEVKCGNMAP
ncbi:hypothetical protein A2U01_0017972 [Trifolium medium]|uniref:Uncharacterized protein n=1 Tax=Trifolium medium TaxID=97028 RepID=A0A392NAX2_9FABA|nr:hypothetical protein [Trifolium medium]